MRQARRLHGGYTAATQQLHGGCTAAARRLHGGDAAATRRLHGGYTAAARRLPGGDAAPRLPPSPPKGDLCPESLEPHDAVLDERLRRADQLGRDDRLLERRRVRPIDVFGEGLLRCLNLEVAVVRVAHGPWTRPRGDRTSEGVARSSAQSYERRRCPWPTSDDRPCRCRSPPSAAGGQGGDAALPVSSRVPRGCITASSRVRAPRVRSLSGPTPGSVAVRDGAKRVFERRGAYGASAPRLRR